MAVEEGPYSIRANGIGIGLVAAGLALRLTEVQSAFAEVERRTPLRRAGTAREAAEIAAFFASQRASFVKGQFVNCDGGFNL
nr:SDR family oxidoreductase [Sphingomonas sp. CDS-1]